MTQFVESYERPKIYEMKGPEVMKGYPLGNMKTDEMKAPKVMRGCEMKGPTVMKGGEMKGPKVMK